MISIVSYQLELYMIIKFNKESLSERIKIYKKNYKDSTFVPNWVAHGFNSKLEALKAAVEAVEESKAVKNLGL